MSDFEETSADATEIGDSIADLHGAASAEGTFEDPLVSEATAVPNESGEPNKLLEGPLRSTVIWLAVPVLLEQFLNFCVGTCDIWLAGHLPDAAQTTPATSAVGVAAYVGWLASMLFSFVAAGTTALVARHWGAGEFDAANRITNQSLLLAGIAGVGFLILIWPTAPLFAAALGLDAAASEITIRYLRFDGIGLVFTAFSLVAAASLRGSGDMRTPMFVLGTVSVVNLFVSATLVYGLGPIPSYGVDGIVGGTVIARLAGGILMMLWLASGQSGLKLALRGRSILTSETRRILRIGLPAAMDGVILWSGHFLFLRIISGIGPVPLAAHMVGIRVEAITYLPAVAWGAAAATMVGQSLGNRDPDRARRAGHEAVLQCTLLGLLITAGFFFGARQIFETMNTDPQVIALGAEAFPIVGLFQIPLLMSIIYVASLRGAGDTRFPLLMTAVSTFGLRLPLAWWWSTGLGWGLYGAWAGMCADMGLRGVMAAVRFVRGRWQHIEV
ncbi:MAG: MATE family efflux transporter [Planctomycetaceae bacterium]|nr:MATE family efflux transporter [Planctomycetaceae bacterium]